MSKEFLNLYQKILQEAEEMGLSISLPLITVLQKQLQLTQEEIASVGGHYYKIERVTLEKALAVSSHFMAYTGVPPYITVIIHAPTPSFLGYTQAGTGKKPIHKFTTKNNLANINKYIDVMDIHVEDAIWYPDDWYVDQEAIQSILNPSTQTQKRGHFSQRWW